MRTVRLPMISEWALPVSIISIPFRSLSNRSFRRASASRSCSWKFGIWMGKRKYSNVLVLFYFTNVQFLWLNLKKNFFLHFQSKLLLFLEFLNIFRTGSFKLFPAILFRYPHFAHLCSVLLLPVLLFRFHGFFRLFIAIRPSVVLVWKRFSSQDALYPNREECRQLRFVVVHRVQTRNRLSHRALKNGMIQKTDNMLWLIISSWKEEDEPCECGHMLRCLRVSRRLQKWSIRVSARTRPHSFRDGLRPFEGSGRADRPEASQDGPDPSGSKPWPEDGSSDGGSARWNQTYWWEPVKILENFGYEQVFRILRLMHFSKLFSGSIECKLWIYVFMKSLIFVKISWYRKYIEKLSIRMKKINCLLFSQKIIF